MPRTVLIVEDDKETGEMIKAFLESKDFRPVCAGNLASAREFLKSRRPKLIVLDLALPDGNGLELCRLVRADMELGKTPIIALTGMGGFKDKEAGFKAGVDQYLEKPLATEELYLWACALLRRTEWGNTGAAFATYGDLQIDVDSYLVKFRGVTVGNLTRREFDLLRGLISRAPSPLSRGVIISEIWRTAAVDNLVDTHIYNLRRKLPRLLAARIQSVPGRGFRYFSPTG